MRKSLFLTQRKANGCLAPGQAVPFTLMCRFVLGIEDIKFNKPAMEQSGLYEALTQTHQAEQVSPGARFDEVGTTMVSVCELRETATSLVAAG